MKKLLLAASILTFVLSSLFAQIPCVVIQWNPAHTEYTVVNFNYNPLALPVQGLDPALEVLVKRTPYDVPEYDVRLKYLVTNNSISTSYDSIYTTSRKWLTTYYLVAQADSVKKQSVDEVENDANYQVFPNTKQLKLLTIAVAVIDRKASGLTITPKQQAVLDLVQAKALKIWNNYLNGVALKEAIDAQQEVDLDEGWENVDPENE